MNDHIEELRKEFVCSALKANEARVNRAIGQQDLWDDKVQGVIDALRAVGSQGVEMLKELTRHEISCVRLFAAGGYAKEDTAHAIEVLDELVGTAKSYRPDYHGDIPPYDPVPREAGITKGWIERNFPVWETRK